MTEKEHTGGRSSYYDNFGVIRDVMQNHLTQALVYSLMSVDTVPINVRDELSANGEDLGTFGAYFFLVSVLSNTTWPVTYSLTCLLS